MDERRYPIGKFVWEGDAPPSRRAAWIDDIAVLPDRLAAAVGGLDEDGLDTPYREGGWTVRQVVHHVADSHMQSYARFKLALTEDNPTIKPYAEGRWALLEDGFRAPVGVSLTLIGALHERWAILLRAMDDADFARTFVHPETGRTLRLDYTLGLYAWHGKHHTAHIASLRERAGL
ncbi:YfiT family bacillithiol transferase [Paenibacillus flagellatus]|uniref:Putative metal-dependent hydrolase DLM86_02200 n=1 Tax=Paenibacillus flagellatus TaxID=2211139 RepID=A0A2V5L398_9BACL|nr:putative metal-dependent hydrolase [Paenibacillus flagellatus]PYI57276.1 putative metal-dependent hydrolase [Paenibacillus flagellatus]